MAEASEKRPEGVDVSGPRLSQDPYSLPKVKGEVFVSRDDQEMALLGKKQQLKVKHFCIYRFER